MKRRLIKALVVLILFDAGGIVYQSYQMKQQSDALTLEAVGMNRLQDGSYEGECRTDLVQVRLRLRIQNVAVQRIELLQYDNGMRKDVERILEDIQRQNSTAVDDVSSATIPSRAVRMAAQNVLEKAALPRQSSLPHSTSEWGTQSPIGMSQCGYLLKQRHTNIFEKDGMYPFYVQGRKFLAFDPLWYMRIASCILRKML